jgi:hypothetical protein
MFQKRPNDCELIGGEAKVRDAPTKCLVQAVPGVAEQERQSASFGRIYRERFTRINGSGPTHISCGVLVRAEL